MSVVGTLFRRPISLVLAAALSVPLALVAISPASAAVPTVGLGVLNGYSVLGGSGVTNTGPSVLNGSLGSSPTPAITGFDVPGGPGIVVGGSIYGTPAADPARAAAGTAYLDAAGRTGTVVADVELGGKTLVGGVYTAGPTGTFGLTGTLKLSGGVDDVWVFQTSTTLLTAAASRITFEGGAQACNVFWKVGSSATLGASSSFAGTILAAETITLGDGVNVVGRLIAGEAGAVTLINDVITRPSCSTAGGTTAAAEEAEAAADAADAAVAAAAAAAATTASTVTTTQAAAAAAATAALAAQEAASVAAAAAAAAEPPSPLLETAAAEAQLAAIAAELAATEAATTAAEAVTANTLAQETLLAAIERADALNEAAIAARALAAAAVAPVQTLSATGAQPTGVAAAIALLVLLGGASLLLFRLRATRAAQRK